MAGSQINPWVSLSMYTTCILSCVYYQIYNSCTMFQLFIPFMGMYFIVDLFVEPNIEYKIHHISCISIFMYNYYNNVAIEDSASLFYHMAVTEVSNVFLVSRYWVKETSYLYYVNGILFYAAFVKYRIYGIYYHLLHHTSGLYPLIHKYTPNSIQGAMLIVSLYAIYGLNLYWFVYINKKIYKMFKKQQIE